MEFVVLFCYNALENQYAFYPSPHAFIIIILIN